MPPTYIQGTEMPYSPVNAGLIPEEVFGIAIAFSMDRTPLMTRLPQRGLDSMSFLITEDQYRPRSTTLNDSGGIDADDTPITVADGSFFVVGDVIEIDNEAMVVTAKSGNDLTVTRGYAGTSGAIHSDGATVYLIGNTRTGGEVDQEAAQTIPGTVTQYSQTIQIPYSVSGAVQSSRNYALPPGASTPLARHKMIAMQNAMDDAEVACYYGRGVALASTSTRQQMKGLRTLLSTNNVTDATNKTAYKPSDLYRDTIERCVQRGGNPEVLVVSTDWGMGFIKWQWPLQRIDPGEDFAGIRFRAFTAPFAEDITVVPAPLLRAGTAFCLSRGEAFLRVKRALADYPRGRRGDREEGDMIGEYAVEVENERHHAWLSGITGWAYESGS